MWEWQLLHHGAKLMKIPTNFKDEMEQAELHSPQLVDIELSIYSSFLNMKMEISSRSHAKAQTKWENLITRLSPLSFLPVSLR